MIDIFRGEYFAPSMLGTSRDILELASGATASVWAFAKNAARGESRIIQATLGATGRLLRAVSLIFWDTEAIGLL